MLLPRSGSTLKANDRPMLFASSWPARPSAVEHDLQRETQRDADEQLLRHDDEARAGERRDRRCAGSQRHDQRGERHREHDARARRHEARAEHRRDHEAGADARERKEGLRDPRFELPCG